MQEVNGIKVTDIKVKKINKIGRLVGEASVTLNDCLVIHNIRIIQTEERRILAFPSRQMPSGNFKDIVHPITSELRNYLEGAIFEIYDKLEEEAE